MKKLFIILICVLISTTGIFSQVAQVAVDYHFITNRHGRYLPYSTEELKEAIDTLPVQAGTTEEKIDKALLLFRYSLNLPKKHRKRALMNNYEYFKEIYKNDPILKDDPLILAYVGTSEAMTGKIGANPFKKVGAVKRGVKTIDEAIKQLQKKGESFAIGYAYFLRANILASTPDFMKLSKETPETFKKTFEYFKKEELKKMHGDIVASLYKAFAVYNRKKEKVDLAKENLQFAIKQTYSERYKEQLQQKLASWN